jgi:hypothetical protein
MALCAARGAFNLLSAGDGERYGQLNGQVKAMKRNYGAIEALAIVLAVVLGGVSCGHQAPAGQPSLQYLTPQNVVQLKDAFNASKNEVRLLLLLSPT